MIMSLVLNSDPHVPEVSSDERLKWQLAADQKHTVAGSNKARVVVVKMITATKYYKEGMFSSVLSLNLRADGKRRFQTQITTRATVQQHTHIRATTRPKQH